MGLKLSAFVVWVVAQAARIELDEDGAIHIESDHEHPTELHLNGKVVVTGEGGLSAHSARVQANLSIGACSLRSPAPGELISDCILSQPPAPSEDAELLRHAACSGRGTWVLGVGCDCEDAYVGSSCATYRFTDPENSVKFGDFAHPITGYPTMADFYYANATLRAQKFGVFTDADASFDSTTVGDYDAWAGPDWSGPLGPSGHQSTAQLVQWPSIFGASGSLRFHVSGNSAYTGTYFGDGTLTGASRVQMRVHAGDTVSLSWSCTSDRAEGKAGMLAFTTDRVGRGSWFLQTSQHHWGIDFYGDVEGNCSKSGWTRTAVTWTIPYWSPHVWGVQLRADMRPAFTDDELSAGATSSFWFDGVDLRVVSRAPSCSNLNLATNAVVQLPDTAGRSTGVYCDVTSDKPRAWRVGVFPVFGEGVADVPITSPQSYRTFCANRGFARAGMGVDRSAAWLVAKRHLIDTAHPLAQAGFPNGAEGVGGALALPLINHDALADDLSGVRTLFEDASVSEANEVSATLPANQVGDHCSTSGDGQFFCGYWFNNGWKDDDMTLPDPEDWGPPNVAPSEVYVSCMYED
jgi:hypothetical protein